MTRRMPPPRKFSRRSIIQEMRWAPMLYLPAPLFAASRNFLLPENSPPPVHAFPFSEQRLAPHYPAKSPLEDILRKLVPGSDEFLTEKYVFEIDALLSEWSAALKHSSPALDVVTKLFDASLHSNSWTPPEEIPIRKSFGVETFRRRFPTNSTPGRDPFLQQIKAYFAGFHKVESAEFELTSVEKITDSPLTVRIDIRYSFVFLTEKSAREARLGVWQTQWIHRDSEGWKASLWTTSEETVSRSQSPFFVDISAHSIGATKSYSDQLLHGVDHWRTVLDGASGIDIYGNNGVAAGDFDNDGFDDFYICQPAGLPNRLFRNRGDGTFEDVTEKSGVAVLDATACAIFADFENKGRQDLLVVTGSGPLLFLNQGNGKFSLKPDAFQFAKPPQGTFTQAAVADYDGDGGLDIYFCLYSYYLGLDQYLYPSPYFDARNGPPNFLLHNEGNATFRDRTEAAGLNIDNDRFSFACAWGDHNSNGRQDLYVANDFGRSNLYRNNGDGTFTAVSREAGVEDPGAGMGACWLDSNNDGKQDIYVSNMWSAAGIRVSQQKNFHEADPEEVRALYRRHARGNSLYQNLGNGKFKNVSASTGVEMGRWAWSSDSWDFDHDGYSDLYVANGYISAPRSVANIDLSSFFWRQVVGNSPQNSVSSPRYEHGWNAINELIRSDSSWNGYERNVLYSNNHDGTFSDVSGISGLDFLDDSRSFALADLDNDGRLEIILKNRNAPQLRILHNSVKDIGNSIAFRLQGTKSNRDAIGAAVTVELPSLRQTKYLQAGSGFLSQHSKELFFGLGQSAEPLRATVRWPSGLSQSFEKLPINHRITLIEGRSEFTSSPFAASSAKLPESSPSLNPDASSDSVHTWLINPLPAPDFSLDDLSGAKRNLHSYRGKFLLLHFWSAASPESIDSLRLLHKNSSVLSAALEIAAVNVDDSPDRAKIAALASREGFSPLVLLSTPEFLGVYNITYRYLFDRRRDLSLPTSFLIDADALIVKLYQGPVPPTQLISDLKSVPATQADRIRKALPFEGVLHQGAFQRNEFTYGVAFFQHGYLAEAEASFRQVIATNPENPEAYYNLGTLYLRRNAFPEARQNLEQAAKFRPDYPEAWNNLGMIDAQENKPDDAIRNFQKSLSLRPTYSTALLNLGNLYRRLGNFSEAEKFLTRAVELSPEDPEANYNLGMLYARQDQQEKAALYLQKAVDLRPGYPEALNNLGILFVREQRNADAQEKFQTCIRLNPNFDQAYLNLARLYMLANEKEKARATLQSLLLLQPDHKLAQQALEMLH
jgi:Tfp pilus assembly protein PilF